MSDNEKTRARIQSYINKMPSLPVTVTKVIEISNNPASSPVDLNKVISMDPVLMGRVLRLINSAYYGLSDKVTSLARAIIMLGINTVKNLALSTAVLGNLGNKENFQALNMQGFWRHSLAVGVISKHIAKVRKEDPKIHEEYFIAGLLHDIGKIPLNNIFSGEYIEIMGSADRENSPLFRAESQGLGLDHSEVGTMIGDAWKLGAELKDAISYHHRPSEYRGRYGNIMSTVHISNYFAILLEIGFSGDRYPEKIHESALEELGIEMDLLDDIEERVEAEIGKAEIFLNLNK